MKFSALVGGIMMMLAPAASMAQATPAPANARVYFINLKDGQHVKSPVFVQFGLSGMGVAPFGVEKENTGHHHLLIDTDLPPPGGAIPADKNNIHYGAGQTEARVELTPGRHTLQLVLGDFAHLMHDKPVVSEKITVVVDP